jgi:hypothetical protein
VIHLPASRGDAPAAPDGVVLFVNGFDDAELCRCRAALADRGAAVETVGDVYAAMARLGSAPAVSRVVVDVRYLDAAELAFVNLAPRYFHDVEVVVAAMAGAVDCPDFDLPGVRRLTPRELIASAATGVGRFDEFDAAAAPAPPDVPGSQVQPGWSHPPDCPEPETFGSAEPPRSMPLVPDRPLSTDGGPDDSGDDESLHDAVRRRMAGEDPRVVRRRPPGSQPREADESVAGPFADEPSAAEASGEGSYGGQAGATDEGRATDDEYSDDELPSDDMDALLDDDEFDMTDDTDEDEGAR